VDRRFWQVPPDGWCRKEDGSTEKRVRHHVAARNLSPHIDAGKGVFVPGLTAVHIAPCSDNNYGVYSVIPHAVLFDGAVFL